MERLEEVPRMSIRQFLLALASTALLVVSTVSVAAATPDFFRSESLSGVVSDLFSSATLGAFFLRLVIVALLYFLFAGGALLIAMTTFACKTGNLVGIVVLGLVMTLLTATLQNVLTDMAHRNILFGTHIAVATAVLSAVWIFQIANSPNASVAGVKSRLSLRGVPFILGVWVAVLIATYAIQFVISFAYTLLTNMPYAPNSNVDFAMSPALDGFGFWLTAFAVVVIAPLSEEWVFRRFMLSFLLTKYSPVVAILVTATVFGLLHIVPLMSWFLAPTFVILGAALGYIYIRFGYWGAVFLHAFHNTVIITLVATGFFGLVSDAT